MMVLIFFPETDNTMDAQDASNESASDTSNDFVN